LSAPSPRIDAQPSGAMQSLCGDLGLEAPPLSGPGIIYNDDLDIDIDTLDSDDPDIDIDTPDSNDLDIDIDTLDSALAMAARSLESLSLSLNSVNMAYVDNDRGATQPL